MEKSNIDTVIVAYPSTLLMTKDEELYKKIAKSMPGITLHWVDSVEGIKKYLTSRTLIIFDEADWWFFDGKEKLPLTKPVMGFSATTLKHKLSSEAEYLKELNINILSGELKEAENLELSVDKADSVVEWLHEKLRRSFKKCGFLIYCAQEDLNSILEATETLELPEVLVNCEEQEIIDRVAKRCLIVTTLMPLLMRGINYRSPLPIHLLIATSFDTKRGYLQALGRVKRFSDRGSRAKLQNVPPFDELTDVENSGRLDQITQEMRKVKAEKKALLAKATRERNAQKKQLKVASASVEEEKTEVKKEEQE